MASFQFAYSQNVGNLNISVKEQGQTLERFVSYSGNTCYYNAIQDGLLHTYEVIFSDNTCSIVKTFQKICSAPCFPISQVDIIGNSSVSPNSTSQQYSVAFTSNSGAMVSAPSNIQWSISGQGTSFTGGTTSANVYVNFGSSGTALLTVSVIDCTGVTRTSSTTINQSPNCNLNVSLTSPSCN